MLSLKQKHHLTGTFCYRMNFKLSSLVLVVISCWTVSVESPVSPDWQPSSPAAAVNGNIRPVQPVWRVHGQLDSAALVQHDTELPWQASRTAKHTAGGMLGASPAWIDVLQKEPHWRVEGLFKDGFTFSLTCKQGGMCQACLQLAAAIFGMWGDFLAAGIHQLARVHSLSSFWECFAPKLWLSDDIAEQKPPSLSPLFTKVMLFL